MKAHLSQSQLQPSVLNWCLILPPYWSFHCQARSKNFSLPKPSLERPSFLNASIILTSVAIDGFRMAVVKKPVRATNDMKVVIPSRALQEIIRLLDKEDEVLKVVLQKNTLFIQLENTVLISRLIEGEFVKYNHILPTSFSNVVTVNRQALLSSIERASIIVRNDRYNVIKLDISEEGMQVSAKSEIGNVNENIPVNITGKDITIAFNAKYLSEYLKIATEDFINLNLNTPIDPCIITATGIETFLYLLLPVRINA